MGPNGSGPMVGNLCFVASIFSMKTETAIGGKEQKGRGVKCLGEMRRNGMVF